MTIMYPKMPIKIPFPTSRYDYDIVNETMAGPHK